MLWKIQSEEKVVLAAPANNKCDKCFTPLPPGAATCPDCGAPVKDATTAETEAVVYPELARANLARMRGDYKQAENELLSVLKRYPNNPSANEMLGDLAGEREDWPHAIQWYELALEIVPTSASIARKLKDARAKTEKKETQDTTAQLGLPDPKSRTPLWIAIAVVLLIAASAGAYYAGTKQRTSSGQPGPTNIIQAQQPQSGGTTGGAESLNPPPAIMTPEEASMLASIKAKAEDGAALVAVASDPRASALVITFNQGTGDHRLAAARIARDAFAAQTAYNLVILRGISGGAVSFMADCDRTKVAETQDPAWAQSHSEPNAWVDYVLMNEWPRRGPSTATEPTAAPSGPSTEPTTTTPPGESSTVPATTGGDH